MYAPETSPGFSVTGTVWLNVTEWTHPVFVAQASDVARDVFKIGTAAPFAHLKMSAAVAPDPQGDGHLHLVDETHAFVIEMYQAERVASAGTFYVRAADVVQNDLRGPGVYASWHGTRAYGGSAIGGLIRQGELTGAGGIRHALALCVGRAAMNQNGPGGDPYVWPAASADAGYQGTYATSGNLYMGALLAIPPAVDLAALGVGTSGALYAIARALQDYGGYIVDACGDNLGLSAEPAAAAEFPEALEYDLPKVVAALQVVTNSGPSSVGGGGARRRCAAPAFQ